MKKYLSLLFTFLFLAFILAACGYKPTTYYVKDELGYNSKYYVNMKIAVNSAKNSVIIKDAVNNAIISKFGGKLVSKESEADTVMDVSLKKVKTSAIQYNTDSTSDTYGYANLYRTTVSISVSYSNKKSKGSFGVSDSYEFAVDGTGTVSDTARFQAITNAASKAFDKVISSIAVRSIDYKYKYYIDNISVDSKLSISKNFLKTELTDRLLNRLVEKNDASRIISLSVQEKIIDNKKTNKTNKKIDVILSYTENEKNKTIQESFIYGKNDNLKDCKGKNCLVLNALEKTLLRMDNSLKKID